MPHNTYFEIQMVKGNTTKVIKVSSKHSHNYTYMNLLFTMLIDRYPHRDWVLQAASNHGTRIIQHFESSYTAQQSLQAYA